MACRRLKTGLSECGKPLRYGLFGGRIWAFYLRNPELFRRPRRLQSLRLGDLEQLRIERVAADLGDEHLLWLRRVDHARGDVDVDAEVVAAELPRLARVYAGPQARPMARHLDLPHAVASVERGEDRVVGMLEDRHRAVPEVLHHRPVVFGDRLVEHMADLAQQLDRGL